MFGVVPLSGGVLGVFLLLIDDLLYHLVLADEVEALLVDVPVVVPGLVHGSVVLAVTVVRPLQPRV